MIVKANSAGQNLQVADASWGYSTRRWSRSGGRCDEDEAEKFGSFDEKSDLVSEILPNVTNRENPLPTLDILDDNLI